MPTTNVVAINAALRWDELAAIPESYATAWTSLFGILRIRKGQTVAIRGVTSALGQAVRIEARAANGHAAVAPPPVTPPPAPAGSAPLRVIRS